MRVSEGKHYRVTWAWSFHMIPWYRQLISLVYGLGVILIALWALEQGAGGPTMILGVVGMSMLTLMLIFGVEIDQVQVSLDGFNVDFTDTDDGETDGGTDRPEEELTEWDDAK